MMSYSLNMQTSTSVLSAQAYVTATQHAKTQKGAMSVPALKDTKEMDLITALVRMHAPPFQPTYNGSLSCSS